MSSPRHAARPIVWAYGLLGIVFVPLAGVMFTGGNVVGALIALGLAGTCLTVGRSLAVRIQGVQLVNTAVQHLTRGNHAETQALLATIAPNATKGGIVGRGVAMIRATIALYEGRLDESVQYATTAIEGRLGMLTRTFESSQVAAAHAVRALAHAALGDEAKAKKDADAAESSVDATPEVIARARLVRALLASRAAYHEDAFRIYLDANARLVLENAMPRERALFRALRRMARNPNRGVYRQPARIDGDRAPSKLASWIAAVAPEAAGYVEGDRVLAESVDEQPIASGVPSDVRALRTARERARADTRRGGPRLRVFVLWAVLVVLCVSVWQVMTPAHPGAVAESTLAAAPGWFSSFVVNIAPLVLGALAFVMITSFARRQERALSLARRLVALGERGRARPALERLTFSRNGLVAATAGLELARIEASEARFPEAVSACDQAIARVHAQPLRAAASDMLLPSLMMESAVAMAARGGLEDADAELAILSRDFPTFPRLASAQLRVGLMRSVRGGDREAACAMARARTAELPIPYREEMLADLVLASRGELGEEDLQRLEDELRDDEALRKWIDAVAPGLRPDGGAKLRRARVLEPRKAPVPAELSVDEAESLGSDVEADRARRV